MLPHQNVWVWWNSVVAFILPTIFILIGGFVIALHFVRASRVDNDPKYLFQKSATKKLFVYFQQRLEKTVLEREEDQPDDGNHHCCLPHLCHSLLHYLHVAG